MKEEVLDYIRKHPVWYVTLCHYPEKYDEKLKFWRLDTLPFIPTDWKYEIIPQVEKQFNIIKELMKIQIIYQI